MEQTELTQPTLTAQLGEAKLIQGPAGADGVSPTVAVSELQGGHRLTITDADGSRAVDIMDGADGAAPVVTAAEIQDDPQGRTGQTVTVTVGSSITSFDIYNGKNGTSPTITVADITGGHRVTVADPASGPRTFDVMDGEDCVLTEDDMARIAAMVDDSDEPYYAGVDLTERFSDEIAAYSDEWAWIRARIAAGNYRGIHVGDYIPFTTTNNVSLTAQIAGIDTYTGGGDDPIIGHHIDFISRELWNMRHQINKAAFNNGVSSTASFPWTASDMYHFINSLSGTVPSEAAVGGGAAAAVDYTSDGIYYYLPAALKAVIVQKRMMMPLRYSATELLTDDTEYDYTYAGYLWLPSECEVFGRSVHSSPGPCMDAQYPLFAHNMKRIKKRGNSAANWWLLSPVVGSSSKFPAISPWGELTTFNANYNSSCIAVCFRVG